MSNFTDNVRTSMSSARRTVPLPHDFIHALKSVGLTGSGVLEQHLDTGDIPASLLQPSFAPPEPAEPPPPDLEGMLGPELSGRAEKESRKYIPAHFPAFPPKHTWMATPVYAKREVDPHTIRERAAKEGVEAEKSLRRLMEQKKEGDRKKNASRAQPQRSQVAIKRESLWRIALRESLEEEDEDEAHRLREAQRKDARGFANEADIQLIEEANKAAKEGHLAEEIEDKAAKAEAQKAGKTYTPPSSERRREKNMQQRMEQRVTVNYGRKFWRQKKREQ
jgi:transcription initiation factor TFIID subunit 8